MIDDDRAVVLTGGCDQGYTWKVEAGGTNEDFLTMMSLFQDGRPLHGGGIAGRSCIPARSSMNIAVATMRCPT